MTPRYPNGGTRPACSWSLQPESIGLQSKPGEVNHLSTRRKRKKLDCVSSGERKRNSLNSQSVKPASVALRGSWDLIRGGAAASGSYKASM